MGTAADSCGKRRQVGPAELRSAQERGGVRKGGAEPLPRPLQSGTICGFGDGLGGLRFVTLLRLATRNCEATYYQLRKRSVGYVCHPYALQLEVLSERSLIEGSLVRGILFFGFLTAYWGAGLWQRFRYLGEDAGE
jgi:hypothetical protein